MSWRDATYDSSGGVGGTVRYIGQFEVDADRPYYFTDAAERNGITIRQVIVFRLRPIGRVLRDADDELRLPEGFDPTDIERSISKATLASSSEVPIEQQHTEQALVNPSQEPHTAERREQRLVLAYETHLRRSGSEVTRHRIQPAGESKPLLTDLYDKTRNNLVEAKGTASRDAIRMAIGQLADYSRFIKPEPHLAVLLPERPRRDLEELLISRKISSIWSTDSGFIDNAEGRFS